MPYPEIMIRPMREDLTRLGVEEWRSAEEVDNAVKNSEGKLMVVVNSICGCAAVPKAASRSVRLARRSE